MADVLVPPIAEEGLGGATEVATLPTPILPSRELGADEKRNRDNEDGLRSTGNDALTSVEGRQEREGKAEIKGHNSASVPERGPERAPNDEKSIEKDIESQFNPVDANGTDRRDAGSPGAEQIKKSNRRTHSSKKSVDKRSSHRRSTRESSDDGKGEKGERGTRSNGGSLKNSPQREKLKQRRDTPRKMKPSNGGEGKACTSAEVAGEENTAEEGQEATVEKRNQIEVAQEGGNAKASESLDLNVRILMTGDARVGKSALVVRYLKRTFTDEYSRTGVEMYTAMVKVAGERAKLVVWDTGIGDLTHADSGASSKVRATMREHMKAGISAVFVCYDASQPLDFASLSSTLTHVAKLHGRASICLVACKVDEAQELAEGDKSAFSALVVRHGAKTFATSAAHDHGVAAPFTFALRAAYASAVEAKKGKKERKKPKVDPLSFKTFDDLLQHGLKASTWVLLEHAVCRDDERALALLTTDAALLKLLSIAFEDPTYVRGAVSLLHCPSLFRNKLASCSTFFVRGVLIASSHHFSTLPLALRQALCSLLTNLAQSNPGEIAAHTRAAPHSLAALWSRLNSFTGPVAVNILRAMFTEQAISGTRVDPFTESNCGGALLAALESPDPVCSSALRTLPDALDALSDLSQSAGLPFPVKDAVLVQLCALLVPPHVSLAANAIAACLPHYHAKGDMEALLRFHLLKPVTAVLASGTLGHVNAVFGVLLQLVDAAPGLLSEVLAPAIAAALQPQQSTILLTHLSDFVRGVLSSRSPTLLRDLFVDTALTAALLTVLDDATPPDRRLFLESIVVEIANSGVKPDKYLPAGEQGKYKAVRKKALAKHKAKAPAVPQPSKEQVRRKKELIQALLDARSPELPS